MKKVYQKVLKVYILVYIHTKIQVSGHSPLPINDFLHPGGIAGDKVLEVTLLGPLQQHLQDCFHPQLDIGAVVFLQFLLHC